MHLHGCACLGASGRATNAACASVLLEGVKKGAELICGWCAGQNQAVNAVADAVLRSRAGLASQTRGSSFLFLGPTGVGKTELAKALAELLFDDEKNMVRN